LIDLIHIFKINYAHFILLVLSQD